MTPLVQALVPALTATVCLQSLHHMLEGENRLPELSSGLQTVSCTHMHANERFN